MNSPSLIVHDNIINIEKILSFWNMLKVVVEKFFEVGTHIGL